jgi:hypothetical protein
MVMPATCLSGSTVTGHLTKQNLYVGGHRVALFYLFLRFSRQLTSFTSSEN